jgi:uncharacterized LabA/DUF88 family protein
MKTNIYIDAANIILSARDQGMDFDMVKLITYLENKYKADKIIYFTAKFVEHERLYATLRENEVEIVFKQSYKENNKLKANCDVEIAHRITYDIENNNVQAVILTSGDGDFASLLDYAKSKLEIVRCFSAHPKNTSVMLKERDYLEIIYMSQIIDLLHKKEILDTDLPV